MYKLFQHPRDNVITSVYRTDLDGQVWSIPFAPANTDYANFKKEVLAGAELQDADGNVMTQEQADDFIKELP
jgi:hypothetical protein